MLALGLVSGALTALLFGVVLLLVVGWAMQPLSAALAVTIVPVAAFAGARIRRGRPETRVVVGACLVGGGIGALAFLPSNDVVWLLVPECVAGVGMGLALAPLLEQLLPETTARRRAANLAIRHLGVTAALVVLAPVIAHDLGAAVERAKLRTIAVVLDAPVQPSEKIRMAPALVATVHADRPLAAVRQDARSVRRDVDSSERPLFDALFQRVEDVFVRAASDAFRNAFLIASALAFAAALVLFSRASRDAALAALVCRAGSRRRPGARPPLRGAAHRRDRRSLRAAKDPREQRPRGLRADARAEEPGLRRLPPRLLARRAPARTHRRRGSPPLRASARRQPAQPRLAAQPHRLTEKR